MSMEAKKDRLDEVLQTWKVVTALPPGFQENVWRRIARQAKPAESVWGRLAGELISRWRVLVGQPAGAAAYLVALLMIGVSVGYWQSERVTVRMESAWRTAYVQSVNPAASSFER